MDFLKRSLPKLAMACLVALGLSVVVQAKASALTDNSYGIASTFPAIYDNFNNCNGVNPNGNDHAQISWISPSSNTARDLSQAGQGLEIEFGSTNSVDLRVNVAGAVCNRNSVDGSGNIIRTNLQTGLTYYGGAPTVNVSGLSISGIDNNTFTRLNYACSNFWSLRYIKQCFGSGFETAEPNRDTEGHNITLSGLNSLAVGDYTIVVTSSIRMVNQFSNGFFCVEPAGSPGKAADNFLGGNCTQSPSSAVINLKIKRDPVGHTDGSGTCDRVFGWAFDRDNTDASIYIHVYRHRLSDGAELNSDFSVLANLPSGDVNAAYGIGGAHRFDWNIPASWKDGQDSVIKVYAVNIGQGSDVKISDTHVGSCASFTLNPSVSCSPEEGKITWSVTKTGTAPAPSATITRQYRIKRANGTFSPYTPVATPPPVNTFTWSDVTSGIPLAFGEQLQAEIRVNPGTGPYSPTETSAGIAQPCGGVASAKPYAQYWRSDIWAGGRFGKYNGEVTVADDQNGSTCSPQNPAQPGRIQGFGSYTPANGNRVFGTFVEYGAFGFGPIDHDLNGNRNVFTKPVSNTDQPQYLQTTSANHVGRELSFGNVGAATGNFNEAHCLPDYFGQYKSIDATNTISTADANNGFDINAKADGVYHYTGNLKLTNLAGVVPGVSDSWVEKKQIIIVVENGNVTVENNIFFTKKGGFLSQGATGTSLDTLIKDIPFVMVIVKNGNIYFDKAVDRVDGIWVAQPGVSAGAIAPNTGIIDTCTDHGAVIYAGGTDASALYGPCGGSVPADQFVCYAEYETCPGGYVQRRITIKGALIAQKLRLNRLPGDVNTTAYKAGSAKTPADLRWDNRNKSNAAERIKVSPELYFSLPPSAANGMDNKYDTYEVLPPLL